MSNPFQPIKKDAPKHTQTDYNKDSDKFIITYDVVERVKMTGEKDTDFTIIEDVVEVSRVDRQKYLDEQSSDVGILNIIEKVRASGDETLLNQTKRIGYPGVEKDALGRPVEDVVDVSNYQVDKIEGLELYKKGVKSLSELDPELRGKKNLEGVAKMTNEEIDKYINAKVEAILANLKAKEGGNANV